MIIIAPFHVNFTFFFFLQKHEGITHIYIYYIIWYTRPSLNDYIQLKFSEHVCVILRTTTR